MKRDLAKELLEDAPCGIAVTTPDGMLLYVNKTLAEWVGKPAEAICGRLGFPDLLTRSGQLFYETHISPMLRLQGFVREISCYLQVEGAEPWPVLVNGVARRNGAGQAERFDYTIFDARERHLYESELREERKRADELAAIVRSSPNAILRVDPQGRIRSWNRGAARLFGLGEDEVRDRKVTDVIPMRDVGDWLNGAIADLKANAEHVFEAQYGEGMDLEVTVAAIRSRNNRRAAPDLSIILRDVTARKRAERHLQLTMGEMRHRIKNTLSVVGGIARQSLPKESRRDFTDRLRALAAAHDALAAGPGGEADLLDLLETASREAGGHTRLRFAPLSVPLDARQTTSLSMALHEMTTNALKYGALSSDGGVVDIRHELRPGPQGKLLRLVWEERGGPEVNPPSREGFGSKMINVVLVAELSADVTIDYHPEGCCYVIEFAVAPGSPG